MWRSLNPAATRLHKNLHRLFLALLSSYQMDEKYIHPFKIQLQKTFQSMKAETFMVRKSYEKQFSVLQAELETLDERYAYGKINDDVLYNKFRTKKLAEIDAVREKIDDTEIEISNLSYFIDKSIELSQNIHKHWQLGNLEIRKRIQKTVFPEGIVVDTTSRTYLTKNVNSLFLAKSQFMKTSSDRKEKLLTKNDEESSLVAEGALLSAIIVHIRKIRIFTSIRHLTHFLLILNVKKSMPVLKSII